MRTVYVTNRRVEKEHDEDVVIELSNKLTEDEALRIAKRMNPEKIVISIDADYYRTGIGKAFAKKGEIIL